MTFTPPETPDEVVARARGQIGLKTNYQLGAGGMHPDSSRAATLNGGCDCSGFAAWCYGRSRKSDDPWYRKVNGGWFETTAIYRDCATPFGIFDGVEWKDAKPGMVVVWGDRTDPVTKKVTQGHVGIVSAIDEKGPAHVIHCSRGNWKATGDAIQETAALIFQQHAARVARIAGIEWAEACTNEEAIS